MPESLGACPERFLIMVSGVFDGLQETGLYKNRGKSSASVSAKETKVFIIQVDKQIRKTPGNELVSPNSFPRDAFLKGIVTQKSFNHFYDKKWRL